MPLSHGAVRCKEKGPPRLVASFISAVSTAAGGLRFADPPHEPAAGKHLLRPIDWPSRERSTGRKRLRHETHGEATMKLLALVCAMTAAAFTGAAAQSLDDLKSDG